MLLAMGALMDNKGLSRVEVICIAGIACFAVALAAVLGWYMLGLMWQGNDANALNTAQGLAYASMTETLSDDTPAYYHKGQNTLAADLPASGYNEGDVLVIDGREQHVERGSYIIEVVRENDVPIARWVRADEATERG